LAPKGVLPRCLQLDFFGNMIKIFPFLPPVQLIFNCHNIRMFVGVRAWSLPRPLPQLIPKTALLPLTPRFHFSEFFEKQDAKELNEAFSKQYRKQFLHYKLTDHWKKNLERK
jgi:hypothetical protein